MFVKLKVEIRFLRRSHWLIFLFFTGGQSKALRRIAELSQQFPLGKAQLHKQRAVAGIGFVALAVGSHADFLPGQVFVHQSVEEQLLYALLPVLRVNAQKVNAAGGCGKSHC